MTLAIPTTEPTVFRAGDTLNFTKVLADFPTSEAWALTYRLISLKNSYDISATIDGSLYSILVPATTTTNYVPAEYDWVSRVELAGVKHTVEKGKILILPDLAAVTADAGYDSRSTAKITLDLINAAMITHGSNAWTQSYTISGRQMTFKTFDEFTKFRDKMIAEVAKEDNQERIRNGKAPRNKIQVRF